MKFLLYIIWSLIYGKAHEGVTVHETAIPVSSEHLHKSQPSVGTILSTTPTVAASVKFVVIEI